MFLLITKTLISKEYRVVYSQFEEIITHSNNLLEFQDICPITGKWKLLIFVTNFASCKIFFFQIVLNTLNG